VHGTNLSRAEARQRAALLDHLVYQVELDLRAQDQTWFDSVTTVQFDCRQIGAASFIDLIAPEVVSVQLNGVALVLGETVQGTRLALPNLAAHNTLVVRARPEYSHTGEGLHRFTDPVDQQTYLYTQFEPADCRRVFAVFEQPDLKGTFQFTILAPAGWTVLSNEPVATIEALPGAGRRHSFAPTPKLSSYLTAICAGPWARWEDQVISTTGRPIPLGWYARASLAQYVDADKLFALTKQGFDYFETTFDYPYPFTKYDQVFCPEYNFGAMENAGLVTFTEAYVFRSVPVQAKVERRAITVLHELAHMWFGDLVTMRWWDDLWLNESFAEFVSHLAAVTATEWTEAWTAFAYAEKLWAYRQDQLPTTHPILAPIEDLEDVQNNFDGITYAKGASVLRQLVAWVGQDAFIAGVRSYLKQYAWSNTTLDDLLTELATASGRDLKAWAEAWLKTSGVDTLRPTIEAGQLTITQLPPAALSSSGFAGGAGATAGSRPHRVGVGGYQLADGALRRVWHRELDIAGHGATLALENLGEPASQPAACDLVLLNDGDLAYTKIRFDPASLAVARAHAHAIKDSLARALVWGGLWDAVRDAELPASALLPTVLDGLAGETNSTALQTRLSQVTTMLELYVNPAQRAALTEQTADRLAGLMAAAPAGSDGQLQLTKAFARHGRTSGQADLIEALLDGSHRLDGLVVDTDLRWELLLALVVLGRAGEEAIDQQLAADPTANGREQAAGLRAGLPDPEAKAAAWLRAVEDPATPNATQRHIIAGFSRVVDRALLRPYASVYFDVLERIWDCRSPEIAGNVAEVLYPRLLLDDTAVDILGRTSDFLAKLGDSKPPLRRLVVEGMADVQRALQAQGCDRAVS